MLVDSLVKRDFTSIFLFYKIGECYNDDTKGTSRKKANVMVRFNEKGVSV